MACSSSSCPFAPAISSQSWKYDVFLSFRGEDTRKTFVDHLYSALEQEGIYTYKDDETLPRGNSIRPSLLKAIEESHIAVVIFSENYADSSWCLDELAHIMKCKQMKGQIVMPIFYDVDPSEVRKQKRKYGESFGNHELENKKKIKTWRQAFLDDPWGWLSAPQEQIRKYQEAFAKRELENKAKVESWRKALVDASNISGWEPKHVANGHEAKVIKEIVDQISQSLQLVIPSTNANLIGIAARVQRLKSKLRIGSGGVRIIGIWGVGGGGKTTLASSVYDEISRNFDGCCFVENIREESSKNGLEKLQEQILYGILKQKKVQVGRVEEGKRMIMSRLCHRMVLIVLDDVDRLEQLNALAGSHDWFGEGSRIIITTRDRHLLTIAQRVDVIHNICLLNDYEALELFCKHAPRGHKRIQDYERLSKDVVSYASGLPLALTVLGCFLCDKGINEWRSALARLKEIPDTNIVEKLKISFNGLKPVEKELFLDIACFFRGWSKNEGLMAMLDACGYHPVIGIKVLVQKALITISEYGWFDMHDLVQEMAHYIVRGEHPNNPEKHTRVWKTEDVIKICAMDAKKKFDVIEAIRIDCYSDDSLQRSLPIIANMKKLRWIDWRGDLKSPFPTNFPSVELCCLRLDGIFQKQLWDGCKHLPNLKIMELARLRKLVTTPDFSGLTNLERISLHGCPCLENIHPSIGHLERLVFISIEECSSLKIFPSITRLKKLETLSLSDCPELGKLSDIQQHTDDLSDLHSDNSGKEFASYKTSSTVLWFFPKGLIKLDLSYFHLGDEDIGSAVWELPDLQELNLAANGFSRLSFSVLKLPRLKWLNLSGCTNLVELSELPSSIAVVIADWCTSLRNLGDITNCKLLWNLSLRGVNKLGLLVGDILLDSMLQGSAIEDHFMSVTLDYQKISKGFVSRLFKGNTFKLRLPDDWYNDFCGFLICFVTHRKAPVINIIIKEEPDEHPPFALMQESNEYNGKSIFIGYVPFGSLRHATLLTSTYNSVSFSLDRGYVSWLESESYVGAELVPRKNKGDCVQTTKVAADCSWDNEREDRSTFMLQHDSQSSIKILWKPYFCLQKVFMIVDIHLDIEKQRAMKAASRPSGIESLAMLAMDMSNKN